MCINKKMIMAPATKKVATKKMAIKKISLLVLMMFIVSESLAFAAPPAGKNRQFTRIYTAAMDNSQKPPAKRKEYHKRRELHDKARDALRSGRIVSLGVIRRSVRQNFKGRILDVRLIEPRQQGRPYMYDLKLLQKDGKLVFIRVNARNGQIINVKGRKRRK